MADTTVAQDRSFQRMDIFLQNWKIKNAEVMIPGGWTSLDIDTGLVENAEDASGLLPVGYTQNAALETSAPFTGTNNATEADPGVTVLGGGVVKDLTVTGVSAYSDIGSQVFATFNNTLTLTRPSDDAAPMGVVVRKSRATTNTTADVYVFDFPQSAILGLAGGTKRREWIGRVDSVGLEGTAAINLVTGYQLWGRGKIVAVGFLCEEFDAGITAGSQTLTAEIGGTNITHPTWTIAFGDMDLQADVGVFTQVVPTAANTFSDGDLLDIELVASGTGFTASQTGSARFYIDIENILGA